MKEHVEIRIDGRAVRAPADGTVAAAMLNAGLWTFRQSVSGQWRGPVCGMGICHECRVTIDGVAQRRACLEPVKPGMTVTTHG